jgi:hypothetical protein
MTICCTALLYTVKPCQTTARNQTAATLRRPIQPDMTDHVEYFRVLYDGQTQWSVLKAVIAASPR